MLFLIHLKKKHKRTLRKITKLIERIEKNERKLEGLCDRVGNLEVLSSKRSHTNREFDFEITETPSETRNSQEQKVNKFIWYLLEEKGLKFIIEWNEKLRIE